MGDELRNLGLAIAGGVAGYALLRGLTQMLEPLPQCILQDFADVKLDDGWPQALSAGRFYALSVKVGYSRTIKDKPAVHAKLDQAEAVGLQRHGSWWNGAQTIDLARAEGDKIGEACQRFRLTGIHLNAEKDFWGTEGESCRDQMDERGVELVTHIRARAPSVRIYWNGYTTKRHFSSSCGRTVDGFQDGRTMALVNDYEPMCYVTTTKASGPDDETRERLYKRIASKRNRWPQTRGFQPMVYTGCWRESNGRWYGVSTPGKIKPGLAGIVRQLKPTGISFWWSPGSTGILTKPTVAGIALKELVPQLHNAYQQPTEVA